MQNIALESDITKADLQGFPDVFDLIETMSLAGFTFNVLHDAAKSSEFL